MTRLRQQYPQNYGASGNISTEFENLIRYINSAELGNNTIGELLRKLFDEAGNFDGPIEFRKDTEAGIQYRIGDFTSEAEGWETLASLEELRGAPGQQVGEIGAPIIFGRVDYAAEDGQTDFDYAHNATDDLLIFVDGILHVPGALNDYTNNPNGGTDSSGVFTFTAPRSSGETVTAYRIRATQITGFKRQDTLTDSSQTVFPFVHDENTKLQVYLNGILQREGGGFDYVTSSATNTVTFTSAVPAGNLVSIITVENTSATAVTGMMFEEIYADPQTGLIRLDKVGLPDDGIPQAKVASLTPALAARARLTVSSTPPVSPATGDIWQDTSQQPNQMKFYDGTQWLRTSPESSLPTFTASDANSIIKVNGTGTALIYGDVDLSSRIPVTQKGSANGVASLDSTGKLPFSQLPLVLASDSFYLTVANPANQTYPIKRIFRQKIRIDGIALQTASGSCSVQVSVDSTPVGNIYTANSVGNETVIGTPIEIDASTTSRLIEFVVTGNSAAADLEVTYAVSIISS